MVASLLSIVIPSYDQGSYIRETIDSTPAQDYRPIDVLVSDGGSKDDTVDAMAIGFAVPQSKHARAVTISTVA